MRSQFLDLPFIAPSQVLRYLTHNEALQTVDGLLFCAVSDAAATELPTVPEDGTRIIVAANASGALAEQALSIAMFQNGSWLFYKPKSGWQVWNEAEQELLVFNETRWLPLLGQADLENYRGILSNLSQIGIGTIPDEQTALAVFGEGSLLDGADSHRLAINRGASTGTASIIFQSQHSGRAEIGLTGDDQLSIKTSEDGDIWTQGPTVGSDGAMIAPSFRTGKINIARDSMSEIQPDRNHGILACSVKWGIYPQAAHAAIVSYDLGSSPLLISLALGPSANNMGVTTLTGTTGPDNQLNIAVRNGALQFENRIDTTVELTYSILV